MKSNLINKAFMSLGLVSGLFLASCGGTETTPIKDYETVKTETISDFVNKLANPLYSDFEQAALELKTAVNNLAANTTAENLQIARDAWRNTRVYWEQSEGFLIGPVDEMNFDPFLDTWPTDHVAMEDLLASGTPLTESYLAGLDNPDDATELTLRGFHPLEYILWGLSGEKNATEITAREKEYAVALVGDIYNNISALKASWLPGSTYFGNEILTAGQAGSRYESKRAALEEIANALITICIEVGEGKMLEPFDPSPDSTITESPYAHNSFADFKNNIIGARNVYMCTYNGQTGTSLSDLVKYNNAALDLEIKQKFELVINSFDGFTTTFEQAIYNDRPRVQNTLNALASLKETINTKLIPHIQEFVKN